MIIKKVRLTPLGYIRLHELDIKQLKTSIELLARQVKLLMDWRDGEIDDDDDMSRSVERDTEEQTPPETIQQADVLP